MVVPGEMNHLLPGESSPVAKEPGVLLASGKINLDGFLRLRVTQISEDSTINRLIALVRNARHVPVLKAACVGVAMGLRGADMILLSDRINKLPFLLKLSRRMTLVIKMSIAISLAIKLITIIPVH